MCFNRMRTYFAENLGGQAIVDRSQRSSDRYEHHRLQPRGTDIQVGVIGFGYATRTFHAPLLQATPGFHLTAVASTRAAEVQAALPGVEVVPDPGALARHPGIDLIVVATPNETHAPLAEAALRAGRHVVVDKPFTVTTAEARHLAGVARWSGALLSVFHNRRWDSDFLTVQEVLRRGILGRLALCESRFDRFRPEVRDRWREGTAPGSGLLYDLGPHLIDQALVLFGIPHTVQATLARQRPGARSDDYFHLVLRYAEGLVVTLKAGMLVSGGSARFALHGDRASLIKHKPDIQEDQLRAGVLPGGPDWGGDPDEAVLSDGVTGETHALKAIPGDQREYYAALREALHGRAPNPVSPAQGATVIALVEAALRSESEGRRVAPDLRDEERAAWTGGAG
ncbi:MAG TPA: oxidoreductase [Gemmatimonadales bacterium]|nr:oxidoreductase [Gemmatimonadales bacterium]